MHRIVDSRSVLVVRNLEESTRFFMDVLGFRRDFGDSSDGWSFLSRDGFKVRLGECPDATPAGELGDHAYFVYLPVEGLDPLPQERAERGAPVVSEPEGQPWGRRGFSIRPPDGPRLGSGEPIPAR